MGNVRLRYVLLGLILVAMIVGIPGCKVHGCGGCGCGGSGTSDTCPGTGETIVKDGSYSTGLTVPVDLPSVTDNPGLDMMKNWTWFFYGGTPPEIKVELLENGEEHAEEIADIAALQYALSLSADVTGARWSSSDTTAQIEYDLLRDGTPVLSNQTGTAVLEDDVWKVSEEDFDKFVVLMNSGLTPSTTAP